LGLREIVRASGYGNSMKILHLATQDVGGGGFSAAYRLHTHMREAGVESAMLVYNKESSDDHVIGVAGRLTPLQRLRWKLGRLRERCDHYRGYSTYFRTDMGFFLPVEKLKGMLPFNPDAIIIHWVANFFTPAMLRQLSVDTGAPLYWNMPDMAPLTGGCHYAFDCDGYKRSCGSCPQLGKDAGESDISTRQILEKCRSFQDCDITAVVGSTWLRHQAEASAVFSGHPVKQIMLGMDVNVFKPAPAAEARAVLGLPPGKRIIFFGATSLLEKRKGLTYLTGALDILHSALKDEQALRGEILVVTAGSAKSIDRLGIPFEHRHLGLLCGDVRLAAAYQAADIFVNASIEDSGPMMINEAVLCGTPVVAFDMGVAPDLVHTGRTGYRAKLKDAADLAKGLLALLKMEPAGVAAMRTECRELGMKLCHPDVQVRAFVELCTSGIAAGEGRSVPRS
jgi:glycosyltransferase involved in cell wall biosynthesis